jgi:hypothetical protein
MAIQVIPYHSLPTSCQKCGQLFCPYLVPALGPRTDKHNVKNACPMQSKCLVGVSSAVCQPCCCDQSADKLRSLSWSDAIASLSRFPLLALLAAGCYPSPPTESACDGTKSSGVWREYVRRSTMRPGGRAEGRAGMHACTQDARYVVKKGSFRFM